MVASRSRSVRRHSVERWICGDVLHNLEYFCRRSFPGSICDLSRRYTSKRNDVVIAVPVSAKAPTRSRIVKQANPIMPLQLTREAGRVLLHHELVSAADYTSAMGELVRLNLAQDALEVFAEMRRQSMGFGHTVTYNIAVCACEKLRRWSHALHLLREMTLAGMVNRRGLRPDSITYCHVIAACLGMHEYQLTIDLVEEMCGQELGIDAVAYSAAVIASQRLQLWGEAHRLLRTLHDQGLQHTIGMVLVADGNAQQCKTRRVEYGTASITALTRRAFWQEALHMFRVGFQSFVDERSLDLRSYNAALAACQRGHQTAAALELLRTLLRSNVEGEHKFHREFSTRPDLVSYNTTIGACSSHFWYCALELLDELKSTRLRPDETTFRNTMSACSRGHAWSTAVEVFKQIHSKELVRHTTTYNVAINASGRGPNTPSAFTFFVDLLHQRLRPDVITFNSMISSCERSEQWALALNLLSVMDSYTLQATATTFNSAIGACRTASEWRMALGVFQDMRFQSWCATSVSYTTVISACERGHHWLSAIALLREMHWDRVMAVIQTYDSAICVCAASAVWEQAFALLVEAKGQWLQPDEVSYSATLGACENTGIWNLSLPLLEEARNRSVASVAVFNAAISALEKGLKWQYALSVFAGMQADQVQPDFITYQATILAQRDGGCSHTARTLYHEARALGFISPWRSSGSNFAELDLHGLPVELAKIAVEVAIDEVSEGEYEGIDVITGRGLHSPGGEAAIRSAILNMLANYTGLAVEVLNPGCVRACFVKERT